MANSKGKGPKAMDPQVRKRLLEGLINDNAFREHFQRDAKSALESIGYVAPEGEEELHSGSCLQMAAGTTLASPEELEAARTSLDDSLNAIHGFDAPRELLGS